MIIAMFIILQLLIIGLFFVSFFTKQEILWGMTIVLSGLGAIISQKISFFVSTFNVNTGMYVQQLSTQSCIVMTGVNMMFFALSIFLLIFDLYDKYGISTKIKVN